MRRISFFAWLLLAALMSAAPPAAAQDAARPIGPSERQNFALERPGDLRIVGAPDRYDIELPTDVLFDFDKSKLRTEAAPLLDKVKAHFASHRSSQVLVWGHTDSKGSHSYNFTLSQKRAKAVCDWMRREVGGRFQSCIGRGEQEPVVPNENPDGSDNPVNRQLNRRVTISVVVYPDANDMLGKAKRDAGSAR